MRETILSNLESDFPSHTFEFVKAKKGGVLLKMDDEVMHLRMRSEPKTPAGELWKGLVGTPISARWDLEDHPDDWLIDDSPGPLPEEDPDDDKNDQILYDVIIKDEVKRVLDLRAKDQ
jgi:hypothetical protein